MPACLPVNPPGGLERPTGSRLWHDQPKPVLDPSVALRVGHGQQLVADPQSTACSHQRRGGEVLAQVAHLFPAGGPLIADLLAADAEEAHPQAMVVVAILDGDGDA